MRRVVIAAILLALSGAVGVVAAPAQAPRSPAAIRGCFRQHGVDASLLGSKVLPPSSVPREAAVELTFKDVRAEAVPIPGQRPAELFVHPKGLLTINRDDQTNRISETSFLTWLHTSGATPTVVPSARQAGVVNYGASWVQWDPAPLKHSRDQRIVIACLGTPVS